MYVRKRNNKLSCLCAFICSIKLCCLDSKCVWYASHDGWLHLQGTGQKKWQVPPTNYRGQVPIQYMIKKCFMD